MVSPEINAIFSIPSASFRHRRGEVDDVADLPLLAVDRAVDELVAHHDGGGLPAVQAVGHAATGGGDGSNTGTTTTTTTSTQ